jgi:ABC-type branched-subunit amino acid transport system substrate-binding protein
MAKTTVRRVGALVVGLALVGAACGSDSGGSSDTTGAPATEAPAATEAPGTEAPATEAPTTEAAGGAAGTLAGMKGTTPLVELSEDFRTKLKTIDPSLKDFNYAAETYDAVTIIALAAEKAKTDGIDYAKEINGITRDGEKCTDFASCKAIIDAGGDPDLDGVSGPLEFAGNGEPLEASYGVLTFGDDNRIDDAATTYIKASAPTDADVPQVPVEGTRTGDGKLVLGTILPQTGSLAFLGPPEFAGFDLAIQEINAAGGVLGQPIEGIKGDSGDTSTDTANQTVDRLLSQNVDAIIGAASSGVSLTVIDKITGAGVVQFSPANTSKTLSDYPDKGLYFRTAPSDIVQGAVLGQIIADDGNATVGIIVRNDSYGTGLAEDTTKALQDAGVEVVETKVYDSEKAQTFDAEVAAIKAADPDAILVISFDEGSRILTTMIAAGIGPDAKPVYGTDGNMGNALGEAFDAGK